MNLFVRGLIINDPKCAVCSQIDNDSKEEIGLKWHMLMPKQHNIFGKAMDDPYRVLLCNDCNILVTKVKIEFQNELRYLLFV